MVICSILDSNIIYLMQKSSIACPDQKINTWLLLFGVKVHVLLWMFSECFCQFCDTRLVALTDTQTWKLLWLVWWQVTGCGLLTAYLQVASLRPAVEHKGCFISGRCAAQKDVHYNRFCQQIWLTLELIFIINMPFVHLYLVAFMTLIGTGHCQVLKSSLGYCTGGYMHGTKILQFSMAVFIGCVLNSCSFGMENGIICCKDKRKKQKKNELISWSLEFVSQ